MTRFITLASLAALAALAFAPSVSALAAPAAGVACGPEIDDRVECLKDAVSSGGLVGKQCEPCPWSGYHCYIVVAGIPIIEDPTISGGCCYDPHCGGGLLGRVNAADE